jgi:hypothetical protein
MKVLITGIAGFAGSHLGVGEGGELCAYGSVKGCPARWPGDIYADNDAYPWLHPAGNKKGWSETHRNGFGER